LNPTSDSFQIVNNRMRRIAEKLLETGHNSYFISLAEADFDQINDFDGSVHLNKVGTEKLLNIINDHTNQSLKGVLTTDNKRNGHLATRYGCMRCSDRFHDNKKKICKTDLIGEFTLKWLDGPSLKAPTLVDAGIQETAEEKGPQFTLPATGAVMTNPNAEKSRAEIPLTEEPMHEVTGSQEPTAGTPLATSPCEIS
jgi:hypothetical protein